MLGSYEWFFVRFIKCRIILCMLAFLKCTYDDIVMAPDFGDIAALVFGVAGALIQTLLFLDIRRPLRLCACPCDSRVHVQRYAKDTVDNWIKHSLAMYFILTFIYCVIYIVIQVFITFSNTRVSCLVVDNVALLYGVSRFCLQLMYFWRLKLTLSESIAISGNNYNQYSIIFNFMIIIYPITTIGSLVYYTYNVSNHYQFNPSFTKCSEDSNRLVAATIPLAICVIGYDLFLNGFFVHKLFHIAKMLKVVCMWRAVCFCSRSDNRRFVLYFFFFPNFLFCHRSYRID